MLKRSEALDKAKELINGDRAKEYGDAHDNFSRIATMWSAYLGQDVDAADVAVMMNLLKCSRLAHQRKDDSFVDACGYMALACELCSDN
jgi:hypothetical protein